MAWPQPLAVSRITDMEFKRKLKRLCAERDVSQRRLAELLAERGVDVSKSKVSTWFSGTFRPDIIEARVLADLFGVSVEYLARPEFTEPQQATVSEDERRIVGVLRSLPPMSPEEAIRRLATDPDTGHREKVTAPPVGGTVDTTELRARQLSEGKPKRKRKRSGRKAHGDNEGSDPASSPVSRH